MKILIMGGTRFFGKRLAQNLLQQGHEIHLLSRGNTKIEFADKIVHLIGDRTQKESLKKALGSQIFDVVVDQVCMTAQDAEIALEVFKNKTSQYILTSTLSVYKKGRNVTEADFDAITYEAVSPQNPAEEYAEGKRAAEKVFAQKAPFKYAVVRIPVVVGEDDYTQRLYNQIQKIKNGEPLYYPNLQARFGYIRSEDAALAIQWLIENHKEGIYNFASPEAPTLGELVAWIEAAVNKKALLLKEASKEHWTPYGVMEDCYMNIDKAAKEGFKLAKTSEWLPKLILELSR